MNRLPLLCLAMAAIACRSQTAAPPTPIQIATTIPAVSGEMKAKSGMQYIEVAVGNGAPAVKRKCVYARYTGWLANGKLFDSSRDTTKAGSPDVPIGFLLGSGQVIAGWDLGFEGMLVGGKRRLIIPYQLGYGTRGGPPVIPPRADLVFDVEVVAIGEPFGARTPTCRPWRQ